MSENNNKQKENNIENINNNKINNNNSNSNENSSNFSNNNNNNNNNNNKNNIPKFEILTDGTLRRYQAFFNLRGENNNICKKRTDLLKLIKNHFNNLEIDNDKVIEKFMRIEKEQTNEKNNSMRKSIRYQEKAIAKFLDNFVSN
jgi:hypothetical protein